MGWGKFTHKARKTLSARNIAATVAAPFTAGASLALLEDNSGRNVIDGMRGQSDVDRQNQFNAEQAQLNRDFQAEMSNTAYQRATEDLEAAGLNRVLAANGAASTPTGSQAQSVGLPQSPMSAISEAATSAMNLTQGLKNLSENKYIAPEKEAGIANTIANTEETKAKTAMIEQQTQYAQKEFEILSREDQIQQATFLDRFEAASHHENAKKEMARIEKEWIYTPFGNKMYNQGLNLAQVGQILNPIVNAASVGANSGRQGLTINNF